MTRRSQIAKAQSDLNRWLGFRPRDEFSEKTARSLICGLGALAINNNSTIKAATAEDVDALEWATL